MMNVRARARAALRHASLLSAALLPLASLATPASAVVTISGQIKYYQHAIPIPGVTVEVQGASVVAATTDANGQFTLVDVPENVPIKIRPRKLDSFDVGISTLDAVKALMWAAGITTLTADQQLACDVTGNASVGALDAAGILGFVVGANDQTSLGALCTSDWLFVPNSPIGATASSPPIFTDTTCDHVGEIAYDGLTANVTGQNFVAFLLGDCTGNWSGGCGSSGTVMCNGNCINPLTDTGNCQNCGNLCPLGFSCKNGSCACAPGKTNCGGVCRDILTDDNGCGASCINCAAKGADCISGSCQCTGETEKCANGFCINTKGNDNDNCGTCGTKCPSNVFIQTQCENGSCKCTDGTTYCSGVCTNLKSVAHCFKCGCSCPSGSVCQGTCCAIGGTCVKECS